jgi:PAP2 superfamily
MGFGHDPVLVLQRFFYGNLPRGAAPWWRLAFDAAYLSHYLVPFVVAGILWVRNRQRFLHWSRRFVTLSFLGFATYAVFPAAPPWMAARDGYLPGVHREGDVLLGKLQLDVVRDVFNANEAKFNQVAAVPSLHAGFTVLLVAFLWKKVPLALRPFLLLYPLTMSLALVARGEHYLTDVVLGALYAIGVHLAFNRVDPWWDGKVKGSFFASGYYTPIPTAWLTAGSATPAPAPVEGVPAGRTLLRSRPKWPLATGAVVTVPADRPYPSRPASPPVAGDVQDRPSGGQPGP